MGRVDQSEGEASAVPLAFFGLVEVVEGVVGDLPAVLAARGVAAFVVLVAEAPSGFGGSVGLPSGCAGELADGVVVVVNANQGSRLFILQLICAL